MVSICALVSAFALLVIMHSISETAPITGTVLRPGATIDAAVRSIRPNYPYSVIPGGAYSTAELRGATQRDPLVRKHYSDFDLGSARLVTLTEERFQYASYRFNDRIYWTRHRLRIPEGEVLLTDGYNYARTRCGNRLSSTAQVETSPFEPAAKLLTLPPFTPELLATGLIQPAPAALPGDLAQAYPVLPFDSPRLASYVPPGTEASLHMPDNAPIPGGGYSPVTPGYPSPGPHGNSLVPPALIPPGPLPPGPHYIPPAPPPISEVPEPSTLLLFGAALCVSGWLLGRMAHANRRAESSSRPKTDTE